MEILRSEVHASPSDPDRVRLVADVVYADGRPEEEAYWFDVPARHAEQLASGGNPWLAVLAPLAAATGEPLRSRLPVDPLLLRGVRRAMATWKGWFPDMDPPGVDAPLEDGTAAGDGAEAAADRVACLFSGGVDSFFTFLRHRAGEPVVAHRIDELLTVGGLDIPVGRPEELRRLAARTEEVGRETGTEVTVITTNVRETRWSVTDWSRMAHGPLLAACGLVLEGRYGRVLVPSSLPYVRNRRPWGSHPFTDPMFSTATTEIEYDGATHLRTDKTARIAESALALQWLRVCWVERAAGNCGRCSKCWRTMAALEAVGALERCPAFPEGAFSLEGLAALRVRGGPDIRMLERSVPLAEDRGRRDIARALEAAVAGSRRRRRVVDWLGRLRSAGLPDAPIDALERRVLAGTVA